MSFYDYDTTQVNEELLPPQMRQSVHRAWLKVLLTPLQWLRDVFFDSYITSFNYNLWDTSSTFFPTARIKYFNGAVYECLKTNSNTPPDQFPDFWFKVQDCFIGVEERLKYTSQIIVFEYALNNWFNNIGQTDQIYIVNNITNTDNVAMANTSQYSSSIGQYSAFSSAVMGNVFVSTTSYDYTIMVPAALFAALGATTQDQENAIKNIANKYNMAGMAYNIDTF